MRFIKYQGLGNDFIVVHREEVPRLDARVTRALCDRRFGVGADGVLLVSPGQGARWRMTVYNADGSRPEMCGNGLRCVVRHLRDRDPTLPRRFEIETDAGVLPVVDGDGGIEVDMGAIVDLGQHTLSIEGAPIAGRLLTLGNPHFVIFGDWSGEDFERLGPKLVGHPTFETGANISFATVRSPTNIELRVWERGAGATLACGTGACATAAAGWIEERVTHGAPLGVELPGGRLTITGKPDSIRMIGDAVAVFEGVWRGA